MFAKLSEVSSRDWPTGSFICTAANVSWAAARITLSQSRTGKLWDRISGRMALHVVATSASEEGPHQRQDCAHGVDRRQRLCTAGCKPRTDLCFSFREVSSEVSGVKQSNLGTSKPLKYQVSWVSAGVSAFLFTADEAQEAAVTPKSARLFACISERAQELMPWSVHTSDAQVC